MAVQRYSFVTDDDGHNYLIPSERRLEWMDFCESDAYGRDPIPEWAKEIDGVWEYTFIDPIVGL